MFPPPPPPPDRPAGPGDPWQDTDHWIQARHDRNLWFIRRENAGYYDGPAGNRTWVPPMGHPVPQSTNPTPQPSQIPRPVAQNPTFRQNDSQAHVTRAQGSYATVAGPPPPRGPYQATAQAVAPPYGPRIDTHPQPPPMTESQLRQNVRDSNRDHAGPSIRHHPFKKGGPPPAKKQRISNAPVPSPVSSTPDIMLAPLSQEGHPVGPWPAYTGVAYEAGDVPDESDRGTDEDEGTEDEDELRRRETRRITTARIKAQKARDSGRVDTPRMVYIPRAEALGPWHGVNIDTVQQAKNLIKWVASGDTYSWTFFSYTRQRISSHQLDRRTPGEAYLMSHQGSIQNSWEVAMKGEFKSNRQRKRMARVDTDHPMDNAESSAGPSTGESRSPVGQSRRLHENQVVLLHVDDFPSSSDTPVGPSAPRKQRALFYLQQPTNRWPMGMRNAGMVWPRTEHDTALYEDTVAWRIVRELAPLDVGSSWQSHQHHVFLNVALAVFSVTGYYARILELGAYPVNDHTLVHYPFLTDNLTHYQVAAWFALHGIHPTGEDVTCLEGFFRSRRHRNNFDGQPGGETFNDGIFPRRPSDLRTVVGVPRWNQLRFGEVAPGQLTDYPSAPAGPPPCTPPPPADPPMIVDVPGTVVPTVPEVPVPATVPELAAPVPIPGLPVHTTVTGSVDATRNPAAGEDGVPTDTLLPADTTNSTVSPDGAIEYESAP